MADTPAALLSLRTADALRAVACLAIDPCGLGGVVLRTGAGEGAENWLALLRRLLPAAEAMRRVPAHIDDERLLGGTDLAATLRAGRAVFMRGLLEEASGGVLVLPMAERLSSQLVARICSALDRRGLSVARDGVLRDAPLRLGVIAVDNGHEEERCAPALLDRLAMQLDLDSLPLDADVPEMPGRDSVLSARQRLGAVNVTDDAARVLCATAAAFGIESLRAPLLALQLARVSAALDGNLLADSEDLEFAARVVLAPRATVIPAPPMSDAQQDQEDSGDSSEQQPDPGPGADSADESATPAAAAQQAGALDDQVLQATLAAIPSGLLEQLQAGAARRQSGRAGRAGATVLARRRGRPVGVRAGKPGNGTRLNILATLRTAAPWQRLRRAESPQQDSRILVQGSDFRVTWFRQRTETVTVFAIDASGSSALHRLSEAKGAVELLLADCYVRRDQVAVVAFRGRGAELLLAPTRSLVRAKRALASLPGGGATPLAAGIDAACALAEQVLRRGQTPSLVILSDGHANVARDGNSGRQRAEEEALQSARRLRDAGFRTLLVDTAPRPQPLARRLAEGMRARYLPLPHADARALAAAVQSGG